MKLSKMIAMIALSLFIAVSALAADWMAPSKAGDKGHLVGDKTKWTYHEVDKKNPIVWKTTGPRTVRLLVRSPEAKERVFTIYIDGQKYKDVKFTGTISDKYTISIEEGKPVPVTGAFGQRIKLGKGERTIEVRSDRVIYVRMNNLTKKTSSIAPTNYGESLSLITGDTRTTYYTITREKPVVFEYTGSGTLTLWSRLAFSETMKGKQHYTVVVEQEGKETKRIKMETTISGTSVWENDGGVIPGKARTFDVKLGSGKNKLTFRIEGTSAPYCAIRFRVS
jgi:hypothetical protein